MNTAGVAGAWSVARSFTPQPPPPPAELSTFETNPSTVVGGNPSSGTVVLTVGAPEGGALIALSSNNPAVASVPATVLAASNSFTGTFAFTTSPVTVTTYRHDHCRLQRGDADRDGHRHAGSRRASTQRAESDAHSCERAGGASALGTVTLSSVAPQGGAVVSLVNGNTAAVSIPASVMVLAGASVASFNISTMVVSVTTPLSILATYNGTNRSAVLTVAPPAGPPSPPPPTRR